MRIFFGFFILALSSCATWELSPLPGARPGASSGDLSFMVISDTHLYDPSLGVQGPAWEEYMTQDRKLLAQSSEILDQALNTAAGQKPQFLLVAGDLTKDGERVSHELAARKFKALEAQGVRVFVVPGNHDILNPHAQGFTPAGAFSVPWVTPEEFAAIYEEFGYAEALSRDEASLSYASLLTPGWVLLALDTCIYEENTKKGRPVTSGALRPETMRWLRTVISQQRALGRQMMILSHHAWVEHFKDQNALMGAYIVKGFQDLTRFFVREGITLGFTGHTHAQDVTTWQGFTDVETGSLVTYPCPVRKVVLQGQTLDIKSQFITTLPSFEARGVEFSEFARDWARSGVMGFAKMVMTRHLGIGPQEQELIAPQIAQAIMAYYLGDEPPAPQPFWTTEGLGLWPSLIMGFLKPTAEHIFQDLPPQDNQVRIPWGSPAK